MAVYLVSPLNSDRLKLHSQFPFAVVVAGDVADARAIAKSYRYYGISDAAWDAATITELVDIHADEVGAYEGMELHISIPDGPTSFNVVATGVLGVVSAVIGSGGSGYSVGNVLTLAGGTFTRAATFRVTTVSTGVVTGIELVDAGEYTVIPTGTQSTTGAGTGATLGTIVGSTGSLANILSDAVSKLNARTDVAGASIDFGASPPLLTVSDTTDALGDLTLQVSIMSKQLLDDGGSSLGKRVAIPGLIGTITDQGSSGDALTVEFSAPSMTVVPYVVELG